MQASPRNAVLFTAAMVLLALATCAEAQQLSTQLLPPSSGPSPATLDPFLPGTDDLNFPSHPPTREAPQPRSGGAIDDAPPEVPPAGEIISPEVEIPMDCHDESGWLLLDWPAEMFDSGEWLFSGNWYCEPNVVVLLKTNVAEVPVAVDDSLFGAPEVLSTTTETPTYEPGLRLTLGQILARDAWNRDHLFEAKFFGAFQWETDATATVAFPGFGGIDTTLGPPAGDVLALYGNTSQRIVTSSTLDSFELNYRIRTRNTRDRMVMQRDGTWLRHSTPSRVLSGYCGGVVLSIDESVLILGQGPGGQLGDYRVATSNAAGGIQFGGEYLEQSTFWNWGVRGRLAGLYNSMEREIGYTATLPPAGPTLRQQQDAKGNMLFLLEGGMFASLQLSPAVSLRASYDFLFLSGVASAEDNLGLGPTSFVNMNSNGDPLYHGASLGLTMVW